MIMISCFLSLLHNIYNPKNREKIHLNVVELLTQARAEIFDQVLSLKEKTGTEIRKY
jgi:hypothetical protein